MTRKRIISLLVVASLVLAATVIVLPGLWTGTFVRESRSAGEGKAVYTCPMHPSVRSDRPGACPVCHMDLVRVQPGGALEADELAALRAVSLSPSQRVMANVRLETARREALDRVITAVGYLVISEPRQQTVAARFSGRIERLHVNETGAVVRQGEVMFEIYSPELLSAEREYLLALDNLQRAGTGGNVSSGFLSRGIVDAARDRLRLHYGLTDGQLAELEQNSSVHPTLAFRAPVSGTVMRKSVVEGEYVAEGTNLYELADLSVLWAEMEVSEQDIRFVAVGQPVEIQAQAHPGRVFPGKIAFVDPVLNSATRAVRVRVELLNSGRELKPNMYVSATARHRLTPTVVVPEGAVLATGAREIVWILVGENAFAPRVVTTGARADGRVQILQGLTPGEQVAAAGGYLLDSESRLQFGISGSEGPSGSPPHDHGALLGHGPAPEGAAPGHVVQRVKVKVKNQYLPGETRVKAGRRIVLELTREEDSYCTSEIVFPTLGIRRELPAWHTTALEIAPQAPGKIPFECGMGMLEGAIIVEDEGPSASSPAAPRQGS